MSETASKKRPASASRRADAPLSADRSQRLRNLPSRTRLTGEQAAARSVIIRRLRIALPVLALVMIGVFFLNAGQNTAEDVFLDEFKDINAEADELHVAKPRFSGIDASGNPYDITAEAAVQLPGDDRMMELEKPHAITTNDGKKSTLTANAGAFSSEANKLTLEDNVEFEHNIGNETYVLRTPAATFTIDDERVASDAGVEGDGPRGSSLSAERMLADNKTGQVLLEGNVRMRIFPTNDDLRPGAPECKSGQQTTSANPCIIGSP